MKECTTFPTILRIEERWNDRSRGDKIAYALYKQHTAPQHHVCATSDSRRGALRLL
jgi:hypothetical protein